MLRKKYKTMSVVCHVKDLDQILRDLLLEGKCRFQNTMNRIEESKFIIALREENANEILEMKDLKSINPNEELIDKMEKITDAAKKMGYIPTADKKYMEDKYSFADIAEETDLIISKFEELSEEIKKTSSKLEKLKEQKYLEKMSDISVNLFNLMNMSNFNAKIGFISKEKKKKLAKNYEKTFSVVLHIDEYEGKELYIIVSPKKLDREMGRILKSTDFEEVQIDERYHDYPCKALELINQDMKKIQKKLSHLEKQHSEYFRMHKKDIDRLYSKMTVERKINSLKRMMVATEKYAYFCAVFPSGNESIYNNIFSSYDHMLVNYKEEKI